MSTDIPLRFTRTDPDPEQLPLLAGEIINLKRFALPDSKEWSLFNPSIAKDSDGRLAISYRSSNYVILETGELRVTVGGKIRNQMWFSDLTDDLEIANLRRLKTDHLNIPLTRGMEDPKLFWVPRVGRWYVTATMMEEHTPVSRMSVCLLDKDATKIASVRIYPGVDARRPEKNWMTVDPFLEDRPFDFIYGPNAVVLGDHVRYTMREDWRISGLRGSSHLVPQSDGSYFAVMHKLWTKKISPYLPTHFGTINGLDKNYAHYFVRFDSFGTLVEMSEPFQFLGRGIEFAAGLVEHGDNFIVSFGKNDVSSHLCVVPRTTVVEMMTDVSA